VRERGPEGVREGAGETNRKVVVEGHEAAGGERHP
jgi:hypothetical protein